MAAPAPAQAPPADAAPAPPKATPSTSRSFFTAKLGAMKLVLQTDAGSCILYDVLKNSVATYLVTAVQQRQAQLVQQLQRLEREEQDRERQVKEEEAAAVAATAAAASAAAAGTAAANGGAAPPGSPPGGSAGEGGRPDSGGVDADGKPKRKAATASVAGASGSGGGVGGLAGVAAGLGRPKGGDKDKDKLSEKDLRDRERRERDKAEDDRRTQQKLAVLDALAQLEKEKKLILCRCLPSLARPPDPFVRP